MAVWDQASESRAWNQFTLFWYLYDSVALTMKDYKQNKVASHSV